MLFHEVGLENYVAVLRGKAAELIKKSLGQLFQLELDRYFEDDALEAVAAATIVRCLSMISRRCRRQYVAFPSTLRFYRSDEFSASGPMRAKKLAAFPLERLPSLQCMGKYVSCNTASDVCPAATTRLVARCRMPRPDCQQHPRCRLRKFRNRVFHADPVKLACGLRVFVANDLVRIKSDERLYGCAEVVKVFLGPMDLHNRASERMASHDKIPESRLEATKALMGALLRQPTKQHYELKVKAKSTAAKKRTPPQKTVSKRQTMQRKISSLVWLGTGRRANSEPW